MTANAAHRKAEKIAKFTEYTIEAGDTLSGIAWRHHSSVKAIEKANGLAADALLRPGQKLVIPLRSTKKKETPASQKKRLKKRQETGRIGRASLIPSLSRDYTVKAGDTLSQIARKFNVRSEELRQVNGLGVDALIRVGQLLKIPKASKKRESEAPAKKEAKQQKRSIKISKSVKASRLGTEQKSRVHTVERGDTLFSIARRYHTPLKDLMRLNGISPTDIIKPGQVLKIPGSSYQAKIPLKKMKAKKNLSPRRIPPVYHTVHHGDTLWKIADRYEVTIRDLRRLNGLRRGEVIHTGQKLLVKEGSIEKTTKVSSRKTKISQERKSTRKMPRYYTVQHGDTLWDIARKEKLSLTELRRFNKLETGELLHSGMKLLVGYREIPVVESVKKRRQKKTSTKKKKVAKVKSPGGKTATKIASKKIKKKTNIKVTSKKKGKKERANRRISSAMAVLNGRGGGSAYSSTSGNAIIRTAKRYLGRRYVWGAEGPSTFDCSGFTQYVMKKSKGVTLPRVSRKQAYYGKYVTFSHLRPGDLIFFDTSHSRRGYVNHVGIYIGNGKFIHASSARHRVVITSFRSHPFYRARFKWGRRVN